MSLKNANTWSLSNKLILFYSSSVLGLFLAVFVYLYPALNHVVHNLSLQFSSATNFENQLKALCLNKIFIAVLMSTLTSLVMGSIVIRSVLKRIDDLTQKMQKISSSSLHERLEVKDLPRELTALGKNFNQMMDRIEQSFTQLSQFSAEIAHELRTPLQSLRTMTEIALSTEKSAPEYQELLVSYAEEFHALTSLIENLLFLARSDHGQVVLTKNNINCKSEIFSLLEYFQSMLDEKQIQVQCQGEGSIFADKILFRRVICNILSNALRHSSPNGKINIFISDKSILIEDNGSGIKSEAIPHLFERFYRSNQNTNHGLGLGLAIVKSIMNLHQGDITINSQETKGTCVKLHW